MGTTPWGIPHIAAAQNQPEVTTNDGLDSLENESNAVSAIANTDADQLLTSAQVSAGVLIKITGALTADRHISLPASIGRNFLFQNATTGGHNLIVQVTGAPGSTVTISTTLGIVCLYSDGTNVTQITSGGGGGGGAALFADEETPGGSVNGTNTDFTLANAPSPAASLLLFVNGVLQRPGGVDFTLSGANITMISAPLTGYTLLAWYRH